jgi:hypothetical protein
LRPSRRGSPGPADLVTPSPRAGRRAAAASGRRPRLRPRSRSGP